MADLKLAVLALLLCIQLSIAQTPCSTAAECGTNECCISNYQPGGKKRLVAIGHFASGHCQTMGQNGDYCYVRRGSSSTPPPTTVLSCPCLSPLTCVGNGMFDPQMGEVGTCQ